MGFISACLFLVTVMFIHATERVSEHIPVLQENRRLVSTLGLTDLCLFTEARYTRHPSVADLHTPFQDYPMSLEHFPTGSLMGPPPHLTRKAGHGLD